MINGHDKLAKGPMARFARFAKHCASAMGHPWAFGAALLIIIGWAVTGPVFGYSDTWQLVINTGTTIITFLMVFLIQNTQNRDSSAIQLKLDEIGNEFPEHADFVTQMRALIDRFDLDQYMATLKTLHSYDH